MRRAAILTLAVAVLAVPAASADHVDDEGDRVEIDYVNGLEDRQRCTDVGFTSSTVHFTTGIFLGPRIVEGGICMGVELGTRYQVSVHGVDGEPAPFEASVHLSGYGACVPAKSGVGTLTIETLPADNQFACSDLRVLVGEDAPTRGTIAVEVLEAS